MSGAICPVCGGQVPVHDGPGRPSVYCSKLHRAVADASVKRYERALDVLDRQVISHRAVVAGKLPRGRGCPGCPDPAGHLDFLESEALERVRQIAALRAGHAEGLTSGAV